MLFLLRTVLVIALLWTMRALALWRGGISWRGTFYPLGDLRKGAGK